VVLGKEQKAVPVGENPIQAIFKTKQQAELDEMKSKAHVEYDKAVTLRKKKEDSEFVIAEVDNSAFPSPSIPSGTTAEARREGGWSWR
jgi:hypothetical protein